MCGRYYLSLDLGDLSFVDNLSGYDFKDNFNISPQANVPVVIDNNLVIAHGTTRARYYELRPLINFTKVIDINDKFSSDKFFVPERFSETLYGF